MQVFIRALQTDLIGSGQREWGSCWSCDFGNYWNEEEGRTSSAMAVCFCFLFVFVSSALCYDENELCSFLGFSLYLYSLYKNLLKFWGAHLPCVGSISILCKTIVVPRQLLSSRGFALGSSCTASLQWSKVRLCLALRLQNNFLCLL